MSTNTSKVSCYKLQMLAHQMYWNKILVWENVIWLWPPPTSKRLTLLISYIIWSGQSEYLGSGIQGCMLGVLSVKATIDWLHEQPIEMQQGTEHLSDDNKPFSGCLFQEG